ncbi:hypothetical protein [Hanstruepera flava]|uniref:hypothetical protein n=1 Tax=Hanstruepera flava TaxID=2930218 RepID=UPI002027FD8E|nr:hypothetical protein [Hanstruepera flava]
MSDSKTVKLQIPPPNPYNIQAVKSYIFNETGNIMLASTELNGGQVPDQVRDVFSEVAVFFAAMTKAISTTINPKTKKPYSLYNYNALQNVIDGSGLFIHVTEEDIEHTTTSFGATFSKELIEGLLGLATGAGELSFAEAMIASMGSEGLKIGGSVSSDESKIANIIFICEYLLGMPIISAMVVYCDTKVNKQTFSIGPCFKESSTSTSLTMHKDTYMFVTPKFIKNYAGDLESVTKDQEFLEFVDYLQALVLGSPIITAVQELGDASEASAPSQLSLNKTYAILGAYLNNKGKKDSVKVAWLGPDDNTPGAPVANAQIQSNIVSFAPTPISEPTAIGIYFNKGTSASPKWELAVATPLVYTTLNPTASFSPFTVSIDKNASGGSATQPTTATIENGTGYTITGIKGTPTVTGSAKSTLSFTSGSSKDIVNVKYTKPASPKAGKATVTVTFTSKQGSNAGPDITGTFDVDIT